MSDQTTTVSFLSDVDNYDVPVTPTDLQSQIEGLTTVRSKILYLHKNGLTTSQISKVLNKRYQHVRNELINAGLGKK